MAEAALSRGNRLLLALVAGLVLAAGQPPLDLWPLALLALAVPLWLLSRCATPGQAGWTGWVFGVGYFAASLSWIIEPFLVDIAVTGWMAPFALISMGAGLALFWALPFWLARRLHAPLAVIPFWALAELARTYVLTGFPWGLLGYVFAPTPVVQWGAVLGPHGLTLIALALAALLARASVKGVMAALTFFAALWGGGLWLRPLPQALDDRPIVRLIQPNAPQHQKWDRDYIPIFFRRQVDFTWAPGHPALIVWPESALPMLLNDAAPAFEILADAARGAQLVVGIQRYDGVGFYNSLVVLDPDGEVSALYDKHHLVPFGEYIPLAHLFSWITVGGIAARAEGGYSAGPGPQVIDTALGRALPLICYEAVFPQDVTGTPERPGYLMQLTNDAWFGSVSGPYQHLMQARMRAIETRLPLIRAANTGVSAVIDPAGRVIASLPLNEAGGLDAPLPRAAAPSAYSRTGDLPLLIGLLLLAGAAFVFDQRNRN